MAIIIARTKRRELHRIAHTFKSIWTAKTGFWKYFASLISMDADSRGLTFSSLTRSKTLVVRDTTTFTTVITQWMDGMAHSKVNSSSQSHVGLIFAGDFDHIRPKRGRRRYWSSVRWGKNTIFQPGNSNSKKKEDSFFWARSKLLRLLLHFWGLKKNNEWSVQCVSRQLFPPKTRD